MLATKVSYKMINGKPYCTDAVVCHVCGNGPFLTTIGNTARRTCNRCEITFCVCTKCRAAGHKLPPVIVNDAIVTFATGKKCNWFCDECLEEIS